MYQKVKLPKLDQAKELVLHWKAQGLKVVFTNGCFDLLHPGHVDSLTKAKAFGDKLVVGVNSDASVRRLKGDSRPIQCLEERLIMLTSLEVVNAVIPFDEDTPELLIGELVPDVLVKGNDYKIDNIAGANIVLANGGKVELLPLVEGYSTTQLLEQIKKAK